MQSLIKNFFFILFFLPFYFSYSLLAQEDNNQHNKDFLFRYYMKMGDSFYHHHDFQNNLQLALRYYKKGLELDDSKAEVYWKISRVLWIEQEKTLAKFFYDNKKFLFYFNFLFFVFLISTRG